VARRVAVAAAALPRRVAAAGRALSDPAELQLRGPEAEEAERRAERQAEVCLPHSECRDDSIPTTSRAI
jgi:hypothetical protein